MENRLNKTDTARGPGPCRVRQAYITATGLVYAGPCWLLDAEFISGHVAVGTGELLDGTAVTDPTKMYVKVKSRNTVPVRLRKAIRFDKGIYYKCIVFAIASVRFIPE